MCAASDVLIIEAVTLLSRASHLGLKALEQEALALFLLSHRIHPVPGKSGWPRLALPSISRRVQGGFTCRNAGRQAYCALWRTLLALQSWMTISPSSARKCDVRASGINAVRLQWDT